MPKQITIYESKTLKSLHLEHSMGKFDDNYWVYGV